MKFLKVALALALTSTWANAEPFVLERQIVCDLQKDLFENLVLNHGERPLWLGKDQENNSSYILFVSDKQQTWTYVQTDGRVACILGVGTRSTQIPKLTRSDRAE